MANWKMLCNLKGVYTSSIMTIPLICDGSISKIAWESARSSGTSVIVQLTTSYDGINWAEWETCVNGSSVNLLSNNTYINHTKIKFRVILERDSTSTSPSIQGLSLSVEPVLVFNNLGDLNCQPEIWITKLGSGDFSIINTSHNNDTFSFQGLVDQEMIYVNNEQQDIETSLVNTYRYNNFNDSYLDFPIGQNVLRVQGAAKIKFRHQYKLL